MLLWTKSTYKNILVYACMKHIYETTNIIIICKIYMANIINIVKITPRTAIISLGRVVTASVARG
jgi:hypothetical protein